MDEAKTGYILRDVSPELQNDEDVVRKAIIWSSKRGLDRKEKHWVLEDKLSPVYWASKELQDNENFIDEALDYTWTAFMHASKRLQNNGKLALKAMKKDRRAIDYIGPKLRKDEGFMKQAIAINQEVYRIASPEIRNKEEFIVGIEDGMMLQYASSDLQKNRKVVLEKVKRNGLALQFAKEFQNDREIVLAAVRQNGLALQFASYDLTDDEEVVMEAIRHDSNSGPNASGNPMAFRFASPRLKNEIRVAAEAVKRNGYALYHAGVRPKSTRHVIQLATENVTEAYRFATEEGLREWRGY